MPGYLDFLFAFGRQTKHRELRFSAFREQRYLDGRRVVQAAVHGGLGTKVSGPRVLPLGRSGRGWQICYNMKTVVNKAVQSVLAPGSERPDWSIRQAAFHHQFDIENGRTVWITASGHQDIQNRVQELTGKINGREEDRDYSNPTNSFKSSLATHLLFSHWSAQGWREYLGYLEDEVDRVRPPQSHQNFESIANLPRRPSWLSLVREIPLCHVSAIAPNTCRPFRNGKIRSTTWQWC